MERRNIVETYIMSQFYQIKQQDFLQIGISHSLKVASIASVLASLVGESQELAYIAGLYHDCYTYLMNHPKDHATKGAIYAMNELKALNCFHEEEIQKIGNAIRVHSDKQTTHDLFSQILKCADVIASHTTDHEPMDITSILHTYVKQLG